MTANNFGKYTMKSVTQYKLFSLLTSLSLVVFSTISHAGNVDTVSKIDTYLADNVNRGVSASVLIAQGGEILLSQGYGLADRGNNIANTPQTVFDIGSLTKQFTAAAILKLVEEKQLAINDTLDMYFSDLPADKKKITLHQLLTHSSGFQEYPARDFENVTDEQYFTTVFSNKLHFDPGAKYQYSNVGYSILSVIVERVSKLDYETFLSQHFFKPLKMNHTGLVIPKWDISLVAHGYFRDFYDWGTSVQRYMDSGVSPVLSGNGGINSTTGDLYKWYLALSKQTVLSKASVELLTSAKIQTTRQIKTHQKPLSYAYGWFVGKSASTRNIVAHSGNNGTFRSTMIWLPENDTVIIYLANTESEGIMWLGHDIEKMLFESSYTPGPIVQNPYRVIDDYVINNTIISGKKLLSHYKNETSEIMPNKNVMNRLASMYFRLKNNSDWALELLRTNVELYSDDGNLWDSLGEGYAKTNQPTLAIKSFKKSLELAPNPNCNWCANAQEKIDKLTKTEHQ